MSFRLKPCLIPPCPNQTQNSPDAFRKFPPNLTKSCLQEILTGLKKVIYGLHERGEVASLIQKLMRFDILTKVSVLAGRV